MWAVAKLLAVSPVARRRRNPNWGSGKLIEVGRALPTEFEVQVRRLGLTKQTYTNSAQLRSWCERNRNRVYVPEWLLDVWRIPVDPDLTHEVWSRRK